MVFVFSFSTEKSFIFLILDPKTNPDNMTIRTDNIFVVLTLDEGELCQQEGEQGWAGQREGWWEKHEGG